MKTALALEVRRSLLVLSRVLQAAEVLLLFSIRRGGGPPMHGPLPPEPSRAEPSFYRVSEPLRPRLVALHLPTGLELIIHHDEGARMQM